MPAPVRRRAASPKYHRFSSWKLTSLCSGRFADAISRSQALMFLTAFLLCPTPTVTVPRVASPAAMSRM
jgi:hypothetical protein